MKRTYMTLILCLAVILALPACDGGGDSQPAGPAAGTQLSTFYDAVIAAQPAEAEGLVLFPEENPDLINNFYPGILDMDLAQRAFYFPPVVTSPCELVMVEVKSADDVQTVKDIFQARIDLGASDTAYPESSQGWSSRAQIQEAGNFVAMIVLPEGNTIPENIFAQ